MSKLNIACYLSSHGYGHAVRSTELLTELAQREPDWKIFIVTGAPEFLFHSILQRENVFLRRAVTDFGLVQHDPRRFSLSETATKLEALLTDHGSIIERESSFLERECIDAIYCDIPFLPFEAAARKKIPSIGLGNFSWDWIYNYYSNYNPVFSRAAQLAASCYHRCTLYLELPASPVPEPFKLIQKIPLICRRHTLTRETSRSRLGITADRRAFLVGFSALELAPSAREKLAALQNTLFLTAKPLQLGIPNEINIDPTAFPFPDLVNSADGLITKPGYGIVSDAIAAGIPLLYTDRGDFPEIPYLHRLIDKTVGGIHLPMKQFEEGEWSEPLERLRRRHVSIPTNGADMGAELIIAALKKRQLT